MLSLKPQSEPARQTESKDLPSLVVILATDEQSDDVGSRISEARKALTSSVGELKFAVVSNKRSASIDEVTESANRVDSTFRTLSDALTDSVSESSTYCAVIDSGVSFHRENWNWLLNSAKDASAACCFQTPKRSGKWYAIAADGLASLVSRVLLKTSKHDCRSGVSLFKVAQIKSLLDEDVEAESVEELIAVCRAEKSQVFEAALDSAGEEQANPVTLRNTASRFSRHLRFWWCEIAFPKPLTRLNNELKAESGTWTTQTKWIASTVLILLASIVLFSNLGFPLLEPDEARNAQLGLNIYESGDWMSLSLQGEPYWDKPPLQAWMTATSFHLLGPSEFATRLPCAIASLLTVLMTLTLGGKLFGFRAGFFGACLLLLCSGFSIIGRYVTMDASLTCFTTAMFFSTLLGTRNFHRTQSLSRFWMVLAGIACGLGFMTKGPVIAVLVLPPILLGAWLRKELFYRTWRFWLYPGIAAFLISAPWYIATGIVNPEFLTYFFWKHNIVRFSDAFNHQQPWWFYAPMLLLMMYPACFLLPSLAKLMFGTRSDKRLRGDQFGAVTLYAIWVVGFFSLSESKLPTYILPALPALCLLLGKMLTISVLTNSQAVQTGSWLRTSPRRAALSACVMFAVVIGVLIAVFSMKATWFLVSAGIFLAAAIALVGMLSFRSPKHNVAWGTVALVGFIFVTATTTQLFPKIAESRSVFTEISKLTNQPQYSDSPIVFVGRPPHGFSFVIPDKQIIHFENKYVGDAVDFIASHPNAILVASKGQMKDIECPQLFDVEITKLNGHRNLYKTTPRSNYHDRSARYSTNHATHWK